jgi:hypothetical protein
MSHGKLASAVSNGVSHNLELRKNTVFATVTDESRPKHEALCSRDHAAAEQAKVTRSVVLDSVAALCRSRTSRVTEKPKLTHLSSSQQPTESVKRSVGASFGLSFTTATSTLHKAISPMISFFTFT